MVYICMCGKKFNELKFLRKHIINKHPGASLDIMLDDLGYRYEVINNETA